MSLFATAADAQRSIQKANNKIGRCNLIGLHRPVLLIENEEHTIGCSSFSYGGDNGARRNVKRFSGSLANCRKRHVYADNRHIPIHNNHYSFNPYHTKNDLKKTKFRPTTGSRIIVINNIFCITEKLSSKNLDTVYGRIRHITE